MEIDNFPFASGFNMALHGGACNEQVVLSSNRVFHSLHSTLFTKPPFFPLLSIKGWQASEFKAELFSLS